MGIGKDQRKEAKEKVITASKIASELGNSVSKTDLMTFKQSLGVCLDVFTNRTHLKKLEIVADLKGLFNSVTRDINRMKGGTVIKTSLHSYKKIEVLDKILKSL